jgi:hypothetical protein
MSLRALVEKPSVKVGLERNYLHKLSGDRLAIIAIGPCQVAFQPSAKIRAARLAKISGSDDFDPSQQLLGSPDLRARFGQVQLSSLVAAKQGTFERSALGKSLLVNRTAPRFMMLAWQEEVTRSFDAGQLMTEFLKPGLLFDLRTNATIQGAVAAKAASNAQSGVFIGRRSR